MLQTFRLQMIFKRKMKVDGTIDKFKARLVIRGFRQEEGIDYFDTYAPVTRITTIRLLLALAAIHNLVIHQMDVKIAFLDGDLEEEVCMKQPKGFVMPGNEHKLCKLVKSLYGLKQAPKQWHQKFDEVVLSSGFLLNQSDKCVYSKFYGSDKGKPVDQLDYSRAIGCLMYAMTSTRPDIAYALGRLIVVTNQTHVSQYGVFQFMDTAYRSHDIVKEISTDIGGEFTNMEIVKCWGLETSRRLLNTFLLNKLNMENLPSKYQGIITEYLVNISKRRILELKRRYFEDYYSEDQYAVSIKEDTVYPCLHSPKTTKETSSIRRIQ
ncbi:zinc finger, CCHC-type containing protein [Tanacetum coccineum]